MRIGLAGLGRIGAFHARTLVGLDGVDSLVVADVVPEVTDRVARAVGAEPAPSPDALLDEGIDGLVVAAATDAHPALLRAAVDAGVPVFCEKPVAGTPGQALRVRAELAGRDERVQIGFPRRFDAAFVAARDAVEGASWGTCTRSGRRRSIPRRRRPATSRCRAASSTTARSTTSTRCAG